MLPILSLVNLGSFTSPFLQEGVVDNSLLLLFFFHNCEHLVRIIGEKTRRRTEQERFVYLTLVDTLTGNHDRHGRNLGFIQTPKGLQLAPFYDNPSYIGLDDDLMLGADLQPRGAIFTEETDEPTVNYPFLKEGACKRA